MAKKEGKPAGKRKERKKAQAGKKGKPALAKATAATGKAKSKKAAPASKVREQPKSPDRTGFCGSAFMAAQRRGDQ